MADRRSRSKSGMTGERRANGRSEIPEQARDDRGEACQWQVGDPGSGAGMTLLGGLSLRVALTQ